MWVQVDSTTSDTKDCWASSICTSTVGGEKNNNQNLQNILLCTFIEHLAPTQNKNQMTQKLNSTEVCKKNKTRQTQTASVSPQLPSGQRKGKIKTQHVSYYICPHHKGSVTGGVWICGGPLLSHVGNWRERHREREISLVSADSDSLLISG